jgi:parvulin-like peptidyl-prolyl isomerase
MVPVSTLDPAFVAGVVKLKPGEVSEPIETRFGYHIARLVAHQPVQPKTFDKVKDGIIAAERQKLVDAMRTREINAVRNDPANHLYQENLDAINRSARSGDAKP